MIPIVTPEEMAAIDAAAPEPVEVLIDRAGSAVARMARQMLGGTYGRAVNVIAGKGNNGADGRAAAAARRAAASRCGVRRRRRPPALPARRPRDRRRLRHRVPRRVAGPDPGAAPVLAVDIPSGVDGLTGEAGRGVLPADRTVTFAALKPGLLFGAGRVLAGDVEVVDIGLDTSAAPAHSSRPPTSPAGGGPARRRAQVVGGGAGGAGIAGHDRRRPPRRRRGAPGRQRHGVAVEPGVDAVGAAVEVVGAGVPAFDWAAAVLDDLHRFRAS